MPEKISSIGGQALMEGVMMRGPTSMAMSVRDADGIIQTESDRLKPQRWYNKAPIIRGVVSFVSSLVIGISSITRSAKALGEEEELGKGAMTFAVILGVFIAVLLFMVLPEIIASLFDTLTNSVLLKSLVAGVIRILLFIAYLLLMSRIRDIKRTFMYHGAEHRTINCYESGMDLTVENVQKCSTRHARCGTTFLFIVMIVSIIIFAFVNWILDLIFGNALEGIVKHLVYIAVKIVILPLVAGLSYEVLKGVAKLPDNWFSKALRAPGLALQALTTAIPDDDMAEVAIRSFKTVMKMEEDPNRPISKFGNMEISDVRAYFRRELPNAEPVEADWILCEVLKVGRGQIALIGGISVYDMKHFKEIVARRKKGEPLDYITNKSYFYGYELYVDSNVLIPRMETEILVSEAIKAIGEKELYVLDLCTGSGCIARALADRTNAHIVASDISERALAVAARNLEGTDVVLKKSDLFNELEYCSFDIIISNPPYIPTAAIADLSPEVRSEPRLALDGGHDGLTYYKKIISVASNYLNSSGKLLLEIGYDQADSVKQLMYMFGFKDVNVISDLDGNDRVVIGKV